MTTFDEDQDRGFLRQAAELAILGRGFVEPNPTVGAIVVAEGEIRARGWHADYGGPHAEPVALERAGRAAEGATLYVTLEPCCTTGKTPPCTESIVAAGVRRVVIGALDPNPCHQGRGVARLEEAGLEVALLGEPRCEALIAPFRRSLGLERPYVILKWAMTLDGRIAARDATSQWISGEHSRQVVHRIRGHVEGVMVGAKTVAVDDPRLNCRLNDAPLVPARIVLNPDLSVSPDSTLLQLGTTPDYPVGPVWIVTHAECDASRKAALEAAGAEVIELPCDGRDHRLFLRLGLDVFWNRGVRRLLIEGGSRLLTTAVECGLADQLVAFVAPTLIGGESALSPLEGEGKPTMNQAIRLSEVSVRRCGEDAMIMGFFS